MTIHAVLTGDIVNSTRLKAGTEKKIMSAISKILAPYPFEFYRGDSFQALIKDPASSLRVALLCRTAALSLSDNEEIKSDAIISIGIGPVSLPTTIKLGTAKGKAFILSGRSFDEIKGKDSSLVITTDNPIVDTGLKILSDYIEAIYKNMTIKQAQVIFQLLQGKTQMQIAESMDKSKSTIFQFTTSAHWPEIARLLNHFNSLINQLI